MIFPEHTMQTNISKKENLKDEKKATRECVTLWNTPLKMFLVENIEKENSSQDVQMCCLSSLLIDVLNE